MRTRDLLPLSFRALIVNKSRTTLTMLGIIIGISSVMLMIGVGQAAQTYLLSQVSAFGSDAVTIANGRGDAKQTGIDQSLKLTLTYDDYKKLKALPWVTAVDAAVISRDLVEYGGQEKLTNVSGVAPDDLRVFNGVEASGHFFSDEDLSGHARVVALGSKVADQLFGQENAIGRTVKIAKQPFKVVAVLAPAGMSFFSDSNDQVYIPFTAMFDLYNKNRLNFMVVKAGNVQPSEAKNLVRIALRESHNISNPENDLSKDDFRVVTQEDAVQRVAVIGSILQILLASIASISLVVAGVGIMNIMYVTVTERTREIGLRKAIGATRGDVLGQFLAEAVMLTAVAGLIGIVAGTFVNWLAIYIISQFQTGWVFTIPWTGAAVGFGVSTAIGIIFGYFPARKAASLNPIESLRYE